MRPGEEQVPRKPELPEITKQILESQKARSVDELANLAIELSVALAGEKEMRVWSQEISKIFSKVYSIGYEHGIEASASIMNATKL